MLTLYLVKNPHGGLRRGLEDDLNGNSLSIGSELAKDCFLPLQNRSYLCTHSTLFFRHITFEHSSSSDCFLCPWL